MPRSSPLTFNLLTINLIIRSFNHSIIQLLAYLCHSNIEQKLHLIYIYIINYAKIIYSVCGGLRVRHCGRTASYFRLAMERLVIWRGCFGAHHLAYALTPQNRRSSHSSALRPTVYRCALFARQHLFNVHPSQCLGAATTPHCIY